MNILKIILKLLGVILLVLAIAAGTIYYMYVRPFTQKMKETSTINYDSTLIIIIGGGGNSGILVSDSLVIVIDTKMDEAAAKLYTKVKEIAGKKPILVVNTHIHPDHTGGNKYYKGSTIIAGGNYTTEQWKNDASEETIPTTWLKESMDIPMGDDTITLLNLGKNIHTSSDIVVYLHRRKMLFAGDLILNKQAPVLFGSADPEAYITNMHNLPTRFAIEKIVPGHGEIGGPEIITSFLQFFTDMKTAAADPSKEDELVAKYKDWRQIPRVMSPGATVSYFRDKKTN